MSIDLNTGTTWQTTIDANQEADEIFIGKSGTHNQQTANLRPGQKLLMEDGCVVNGQFAVSTFFNANANNAHGAEIGALTVGGPDPPQIHSYAPGSQQSVISLINATVAVRDILLHGFILRDSWGAADNTLGHGIAMGENTYLLRLDISGMGKSGVNWSGGNSASGTNPLWVNFNTGGGTIDDCDIHHNAPNGGSDAGGISKIVHGAKGRVLKNSRLYGNHRANIWADFLGWNNTGIGLGQFGQWTTGWLEIVNCDLFQVDPTATLAECVFLEVTSGVHMHHNRIYLNQSTGGTGLDGAHIIAHNGAFNTIEDNIIFDNGTRSFGCAQSARYPGNGQLHTVEGNAFRRNKVYLTDTAVVFITGLSCTGTGSPNFQLLQGGGGGTFNPFTDGVPNVWEDQEYYVLDTLHNSVSGELFNLRDNGGNFTFAGWQAQGFDAGSIYQVLTAGELPTEVPPLSSVGSVTRRHKIGMVL